MSQPQFDMVTYMKVAPNSDRSRPPVSSGPGLDDVLVYGLVIGGLVILGPIGWCVLATWAIGSAAGF